MSDALEWGVAMKKERRYENVGTCLRRGNKKLEWVSYSFSHLFSCLNILIDDGNEIKNDFKGNEISTTKQCY